MQSPSTPPSDPLLSQHPSPGLSTHSAAQPETPQQHIPTLSRDTTPVAASKPSTPPSLPQSQPLTPPDSDPRTSPAASVKTGSTLSAAAPQFRTRLIDAPIDLAGLVPPTDGQSSLLQQSTMGSGGGSILDLNVGLSLADDGRTPTQESFPPIHAPAFVSPSPSFSSAGFSPDLGSQCSSSSLSSQASGDAGLRTPNVYINGLPPNFPEDKLLEMTSQYGEVLSVRTFTRHVSEKPSGYGFVLFSSVEAAAKCIEALRKYRNLHPSFSKQIHKIPGTAYANSVALPVSSTEPPDSFKNRMERLKDTGSTNLYMEGLPLTINVAMLQALVSPYKIMSSRLFQTRLSNPPRIIAFVRLESREAAEEVIERLHGRMVRGWNDTGSRISVRFADTTEQRELRRTERTNRDGENSPARLTMAQAALLNMKGTQLQPGSPSPRLSSPNLGFSPPMLSNLSLSPDPYAPISLPELPPPIGLHNQHALDESLRTLRTIHTHQNDGLHSQAADFVSAGLRMPAFNDDQAFAPELLQMQLQALSGGAANLASATRAQGGFTPMERLILQAHETLQQDPGRILQTQLGAHTEFNMSAPDVYASDARLGGLGSASVPSTRGATSRSLMNPLPSMSEADFHATSGGHRQVLHSTANASAPALAGTKQEQKAVPLTMDLESRLTFTRQRNQTAAEARAQAQAEAQAQALHTRSTTVPSHYLTNDRLNSQAVPNNRGLNSSIHSTAHAGNAPHTELGSVTKDIPQASARKTNSLRTTNDSFKTPLSGNIARDVRSMGPPAAPKPQPPSAPTASSANALHTRIDTVLQTRKMPLPRGGAPHDTSDEDDGSGLDSPALSYSASIRTPASLSPSTPFSAFGETFEGPPMAPGVKVPAAAGDAGYAMGTAVGLPTNVKQKMRGAE
ncbi:hypothetical protein PsYK624_025060 [Phanerochaete sordida]|uniref:RRM domain-containing protein n=1 Tax=Phanerochaete sordida TaxID=48140 RepID=A0A9P3L8S5_9APHY|nr:hypothetical protein PsYK624_025060 [Phanerochaete sordida]